MGNIDKLNITSLWFFIFISFNSVGFQHTLLIFEDVCVDAAPIC